MDGLMRPLPVVVQRYWARTLRRCRSPKISMRSVSPVRTVRAMMTARRPGTDNAVTPLPPAGLEGLARRTGRRAPSGLVGGVDAPDDGVGPIAAVGAGDDGALQVGGELGECRVQLADRVSDASGDGLSGALGGMV